MSKELKKYKKRLTTVVDKIINGHTSLEIQSLGNDIKEWVIDYSGDPAEAEVIDQMIEELREAQDD